MARIVCCGEGMLELSRKDGDWRLGFGGDALNIAVHLARAGHDVAFLTALGSDPFSLQFKHHLASEGVDLSLLVEHPSRQAGLYAINTDEHGERSFTYWREHSAAREMFSLIDQPLRRRIADGTDLFVFSLISLAILPADDVASLLLLAGMVRQQGGRVAFDGNYRPQLWSTRSVDNVRSVHDAGVRSADFGLPTLDDEAALLGLADPSQVAAHWNALGCDEVIVKLGAAGCRVPDGTIIAPEQKLTPVDTSGAGDAFDAGYLSARLNGADPVEAANAGNRLAGWTIMRPGAIPPAD